jgi:type VI secretion system protein ImpJ
MFMAPQHLQQQDLYHEAFIKARLAALSPYGWGVAALEIDAEALTAGQLQLLRFAGVLPDGTPLEFERGQDESPASRSVEEHFLPNHRAVEVFLGLPKEREGVDSYSASKGEGPLTRYAVTTRAVPDLLAAHSVAQVSFSKGNVRVLFGSEPRDDFEAVKIAEIVRTSSGSLALHESYIPPCLRVSAAPFILAGVRRLLKLVLGKQRELADARRHRDASSLEFTASDVTRYLQLNTLNSIIPVLQHITDTGDLPPLDVYLLLIQVVGQLFTFDAEGDPSGLPKFQFLNLQKTFEELFARATSLLRVVALEQCIPVPLEQRAGGLSIGKLEDERLLRCPQFILTVKSSLPEKQVADQFPRLSKIASGEEIHSIVQAASPGVPLQLTFRPPPEVPVRPGVVYFSLTTQSAYWKNALRDRSVAIYLPTALDPSRTQIELLGIPSTSST